MLHETARTGTTVVLSTHDESVAETCDVTVRLGGQG
jgi:predicted ABC-type transport system involved in lysophospholipase L1 biosynthesis ATPase subunit